MDEYSQGYGAYNIGLPYYPDASLDWREGWRDAERDDYDMFDDYYYDYDDFGDY